MTDDEVAARRSRRGMVRRCEPAWEATVRPVLEEATLTVPAPTAFRSRGKLGVHSEHLGHLLTEMQYLQRAYPGAQW